MTIPRVLIEAPRVPLSDRSGWLVMLPMEGAGERCPTCPPGQGVMGLAIIRQEMPSGEWSYGCLPCAGPGREA